MTAALVSLSKTESNNCKELIARVFNAICEQQALRGKVVQQGGTKVLIPMALEGNLCHCSLLSTLLFHRPKKAPYKKTTIIKDCKVVKSVVAF